MSDIATLMRAANPVPDSEAALSNGDFDALLLLTQSRSGNVDVQELTKPAEPEKKKQYSGWLIAAAAFAVVIVFVGAAMLLANPVDELPPATTPPTTQAAPPTTQAAVEEEAVSTEVMAVIVEYADAVNLGDLVGLESLLSESFEYHDSASPGYPVTRDLHASEQRYWSLEGSRVVYVDCEPSQDGAVCMEEWVGPVSDALWPVGPLKYRITFTMQGGQIARMDGSAVSWPSDYSRERERIVEWVEGFDEAAAATMREAYGWGSRTPDAAPLWLKYAPLWAEAGRP